MPAFASESFCISFSDEQKFKQNSYQIWVDGQLWDGKRQKQQKQTNKLAYTNIAFTCGQSKYGKYELRKRKFLELKSAMVD